MIHLRQFIASCLINHGNNYKFLIMSNLKRSIYALSAKTPYEKSLLKATYDGDYDSPKEKHVQTILWTLQGQNNQMTPDGALSLLTQRLMTSRWTTVMKTLIILHRGIEQIGASYSAKLADLNLPIQNFNDPSERGSAHNQIIQDYFTFIRSKALNCSRKGSIMLTQPSERYKAIERLDGNELVKEIGLLLVELQNMVKIGPGIQQAIRNYHLKVTQNAAYLILKDANPLFRTLQAAMDKLIDKFFSLGGKTALAGIEHYKKFENCQRMLSQFFELGHSLPFGGLTTPNFVNRPRELLDSMKSYAEDNAGLNDMTESGQMSSELALSPQEIEEQRKILEGFERAHQRKLQEETKTQEKRGSPQKAADNHEDLFFEGLKPPQQTQEVTKADIVMSAFNASQGQQMPAQDMSMMNQMMNPMMMNPMMTGMMMNPMMTGMMNPMMTGMMSPMMNPMMNPMMGQMGMPGMAHNPSMGMPGMANTQMMGMPGMANNQQRSNLDPFSQPTNNQKNPFNNQQRSQSFAGPAPSNNPPSFDNMMPRSSNPFENSQKPQANNPFAGNPTSNPFETKPSQYQTNQVQHSRDPFGDLI